MSVLNPSGDPMGAAIYDYHKNGKADTLYRRNGAVVFGKVFDFDQTVFLPNLINYSIADF